MVGFGRGNDALGARKLNAGREGVQLLYARGFDQAQIEHMRDQRRHAVIAQAAGVNSGRDEGAAQRVHLDQRREMAGVAEVVSERPLVRLGQAAGSTATTRASHLPFELAAEVRHDQAGEVRAAAGAADDHVGLVAGQRHLLDGFEPDDGLMQQHVIQHAAQRVLGVGILGGNFDGFRNGDAQRTRAIGMFGENGAAGFSLGAGARR